MIDSGFSHQFALPHRHQTRETGKAEGEQKSHLGFALHTFRLHSVHWSLISRINRGLLEGNIARDKDTGFYRVLTLLHRFTLTGSGSAHGSWDVVCAHDTALVADENLGERQTKWSKLSCSQEMFLTFRHAAESTYSDESDSVGRPGLHHLPVGGRANLHSAIVAGGQDQSSLASFKAHLSTNRVHLGKKCQ